MLIFLGIHGPNSSDLLFIHAILADASVWLIAPECTMSASSEVRSDNPSRTALRDHFFNTRDVSERLKGKIYSGGVLAVLLYGYESWIGLTEAKAMYRQKLTRKWGHIIAREWATLLLDRLRDFVEVPSSAGLNSSLDQHSRSTEERVTLDRYHQFYGHSGMCA